MANEVNVFELTNTALKSLYNEPSSKKGVKESVTKKTSRKANKKESVKKVNKIACNKIKLESLSFMEDADAEEFDFTPDDEVVVVIDPELEEVPATEEDAVAAAEELVGDTICKCAVCGANYVCDCEETMEEDIDGETKTVVVDGTCPICGEDGSQIVVGEIVPTDDAPATDDVEGTEDDTAVDTDTDADDEEFDDFDTEDEDEEEPAKENVRRPRRPIMTRKESIRRKFIANKRRVAENRNKTRNTMNRRPVAENRMNRPVANRTARQFKLDEVVLNRLFNKFAKENYSNVASVRFTKGSLNRNRLTLEGVVRTVKGSRRTIKLVSENFKPTNRVLQFKEYGPFTESAKVARNKATFVVECTIRNGVITPKTLKYNYTTPNGSLKKESRNRNARKEMYRVSGIVK